MTYFGSGDPAKHRTDYKPKWLSNLAEGFTMEASVMNGLVEGPNAVRTLLSFARTLYDYQEFNVIGTYGGHDLVEDYTSLVHGDPIGSIVVVRFDDAGKAKGS